MTYREAQGSETSELVYAPRAAPHSRAPLEKAVVVFGAGACAAGLAGWLISPKVAGLVLVAAVVIAVWRHRRAASVAKIILRLHRGELEVVDAATGELRTTIRLAALRDVALDSTTIHLVKRDDDQSYVLSAGGSDLDLSRIALVLEPPAAPLALTATNVVHADCVEQRAKIRAFLRGHGWVPADERPPDSTASEEDDPSSS